MYGLIIEKKTITTSYVALSSERVIGTVEIAAPPTNSGTVYIEGTDGNDVPLIGGEWKRFDKVDLSKIKVKGTADDVLTVIGGTW